MPLLWRKSKKSMTAARLSMSNMVHGHLAHTRKRPHLHAHPRARDHRLVMWLFGRHQTLLTPRTRQARVPFQGSFRRRRLLSLALCWRNAVICWQPSPCRRVPSQVNTKFIMYSQPTWTTHRLALSTLDYHKPLHNQDITAPRPFHHAVENARPTPLFSKNSPHPAKPVLSRSQGSQSHRPLPPKLPPSRSKGSQVQRPLPSKSAPSRSKRPQSHRSLPPKPAPGLAGPRLSCCSTQRAGSDTKIYRIFEASWQDVVLTNDRDRLLGRRRGALAERHSVGLGKRTL